MTKLYISHRRRKVSEDFKMKFSIVICLVLGALLAMAVVVAIFLAGELVTR